MLALLMLLPVPQVLAAVATNRVEQAAFAYEAPAGWTVLKNEVRRDFAVLSFANAEGELIQLSVSGRLTAEQYAGAKTRLQAVDQQPMQRGWTLVETRTVEMQPYGTVSESLYYDHTYELTAYSYNVFGPEHIALFTITFKGIKPDTAESARKLVGGLQWR